MWGTGKEKPNCCPLWIFFWNLVCLKIPGWIGKLAQNGSHCFPSIDVAVMPSNRAFRMSPAFACRSCAGLWRMSSWAQVHHSSEIRAQSLATNLLPKGMLGESSNYFSRKIQVGEILYMWLYVYWFTYGAPKNICWFAHTHCFWLWSSDQQWWRPSYTPIFHQMSVKFKWWLPHDFMRNLSCKDAVLDLHSLIIQDVF